VATLGAVSALVAAVWINGWEWPHVYAAISRGVTTLLTFDWLIECIQRVQLKWVAAIALLSLVAWLALREPYTKMVWPTARYKLLRDRAGFWRKVLALWNNLKRVKGNLLWLFKFLPLSVAVLSAVAWVSHCLFAKPFQWKTRDPDGLDR
jgi:hypothetical protein